MIQGIYNIATILVSKGSVSKNYNITIMMTDDCMRVEVGYKTAFIDLAGHTIRSARREGIYTINDLYNQYIERGFNVECLRINNGVIKFEGDISKWDNAGANYSGFTSMVG